MVDFDQGSEEDLDDLWAIKRQGPVSPDPPRASSFESLRSGAGYQHRINRRQEVSGWNVDRLLDDQACAFGHDHKRFVTPVGTMECAQRQFAREP